MATMPSLEELQQEILTFRNERDWAQFHTPRNLAAALSIEAGELQETMLWKSDAEIARLVADSPSALRQECADVLIYALLLCDAIGASPTDVIREKLLVNAARYPVEKARGVARKYNEL